MLSQHRKDDTILASASNDGYRFTYDLQGNVTHIAPITELKRPGRRIRFTNKKRIRPSKNL